ncbi:hypothetical protein GCM10010112_48240 [Actinoplanes lobatus]|uniref:Uncharacterized protein n=1 Tax=Actinoplanes lobatus TaxID=113568 RepID=A0A7W7HFU9_9ACTN|nr:hypothetical protein [Actinoplanes lobatus]MBB4749780.1 hypothetical protein [Actinoplanes lobatus]GGN76212.1 hypothetical protein GCM10010112_48240 [Actinoplanes lobatus]GIE38515.1 hypothetical protein Alo02nite_14130 [Actinoplanes lobatus]
MSVRPRLVPHAVAAAVTAVVLAPLAMPGYALRYDMVFVPRQALSWEMIAPADALPRAVPLDAVVALANLAVPGWLLQRVALVAVVYLAALGAARLLPSERTLPRVVAAIGYAWTPFLAERLLLGQWALLLAYAMMPWLVKTARDVRAGRPNALPRLVLAAAPAAVTPTGGLIALVTVAVLLPLRSRRTMAALAAVAALNAPWLVSSLVSAAGGVSDPEGVAQFAARAENWAGPVVALLGTGGIWNGQTVPASRTTVLAPLVTLLILIAAAAGVGELRRRLPDVAGRLLILAAGGFLLAVAGVVGPGVTLLEWLVVHVPGAGLLRDGQKFLIPYALALALCFALGVERLADRLAARFEPTAGRILLAAALLLPLVALPDLAWGVGGALRPVRYPADWAAVRARVEAAPGEVLSLPFEGYQRYPWTDGVVVRDPAPRYLDVPVLINDALRVGPVLVDGESPRATAAAAILAAGRPAAEIGTHWVLVRRGSGEPDARVLSGLRLVYDGRYLQLWENPSTPAVVRSADPGRRAAALAAHLLAAMVLVGAIVLLRRRSRSTALPSATGQ